MPDIAYFKYFVRVVSSQMLGKYDITLKNFIKMIKHNMSPRNRIVNYDIWLKDLTEDIIKKKNFNSEYIDVSNLSKQVCILNTKLYDTGGHTELLVRELKHYHSDYPMYVYLTNSFLDKKESQEQLEKFKLIKEFAKDYHVSSENVSLTDKVFEAFTYITDNKITKIICNFHMHDAVSCMILYMLKKYTNIEIDFWNHGDHFYSLGTTFVDKIYTRTKNGKACSPYLQNNKKVVTGKFLFDKTNNHYDEQEFVKKRAELNIPEGAFITLTGCGMHKLCPNYFKMIHKMLKKNKNIYHIFVCTMKDEMKQKLQKKYKLNERFIIIDFVANFDFYIQLSDLYVDSFPQGSALTLVDYIKYSKPVVIKINKKEPERSFEEYLYPNYEYAFENIDDMLGGILELSNDSGKYAEMSDKVYKYFERTYI